MVEITCVVDAKAELGEGTLWDPEAGVLWWIDIWQKHIHRYNPATGKDEIFETPEYLGCLGLREKGGLVLTMVSGFYFFDPVTGVFEPIADPEAHMPHTRFNDGKPDRQGRFWSGTMFEVPGKPIEFVGALYRMDPDLSRPQDDRGRRLLQRTSLQPGQPDDVFFRQPFRPSRRL